MSQSYLSLGRAKEVVVEIVESSPPGTKNPRMRGKTGMCLYLWPKTGKRCIVGEVLHRMKMPAPRWDGSGFNLGTGDPYVDKGYMSETTRKWLSKVQYIFDGADGISPSRTWRQSLAVCRKQGLL